MYTTNLRRIGFISQSSADVCVLGSYKVLQSLEIRYDGMSRLAIEQRNKKKNPPLLFFPVRMRLGTLLVGPRSASAKCSTRHNPDFSTCAGTDGLVG